MLVTLGENGVKTLDDFADLAGDELLEMLSTSDKGGAKLELEEANALIMKARAHWFEGDEAASTAAALAAVEPAPAGREETDGRHGDGHTRHRRRLGGGPFAAATLHRDRRKQGSRPIAAVCRGSRWRDRAGCGGAGGGAGVLV